MEFTTPHNSFCMPDFQLLACQLIMILMQLTVKTIIQIAESYFQLILIIILTATIQFLRFA